MTCAGTITAAFLVASVAGPAMASGEDPPYSTQRSTAKVHAERGARYYAAGDYAAAIDALELAYELDPQRDLLYALAQATRLNGDCPGALKLYRQFLDAQPPGHEAEQAQLNIERCAELLAARQAERESRPPVVVQPAIPPTPPAPAPRPPWYRDTLGGALAISGLAVVAGGVGFYAWALSERSAAGDARTYAESVYRLDRAQSRRQFAMIGLTAGSALIMGGVLRYVFTF